MRGLWGILLVAGLLAFGGMAPASAGYDDDVATCLDHKADNDAAIGACGRMIAAGKPKDLDTAYNNRGVALAAKGEHDAAIADFTQAIRLNGRDYLHFRNRGDSWQAKEEDDKAIADFDQAIRLNPKDAVNFNNRGVSWFEKGDFKRAIADYSKAISLDQKTAIFFRNRGDAHGSGSNPDYVKQIADYDRAIRMDATDAQAFNSRGLAYYTKGDNDRAIADFDRAIRMTPNDPIYLRNRGDAWSEKNDSVRALADYDHSLRLNQQDAWSYVQRGLLHEKLGNTEKARNDFNAALGASVGDDIEEAYDKARERLAALAPPQTAPLVTAAAAPVPTASPRINPAAAGRRVALVIGNADYKYATVLRNPRADATSIANSLRRVGFQSVTLANDLNREQLIAALRSFAAEADQADWAVIYFSGHGMEVNGMNYVIPVDAKLVSDRDVQFEAVPLDQVLGTTERARKLRLVLLDACRDNPFANYMKRVASTRAIGRGLSQVEPDAGMLVVYAAKHGQYALDGDGANSPFAAALVNRIETPQLDIRKLFDLVRDDVMDATDRRQQPFSYGSVSGREDFHFVASR
jgi:tetratricopeptide (TPR) repeat protein